MTIARDYKILCPSRVCNLNKKNFFFSFLFSQTMKYFIKNFKNVKKWQTFCVLVFRWAAETRTPHVTDWNISKCRIEFKSQILWSWFFSSVVFFSAFAGISNQVNGWHFSPWNLFFNYNSCGKFAPLNVILHIFLSND